MSFTCPLVRDFFLSSFLDTQLFPQHTLLLQKLAPLWENGFHNWAQIIGRAPDGRPYFLEDKELTWANHLVRFPFPQNLVHALTYLKVTLASTSIDHWHIFKRKVAKLSGWDDPIAHRRRSILEMD
jgi:hypothetical protein